ncbi:MAG: UDP-N-acetylmuramate dehydrogenase [bacterium]
MKKSDLKRIPRGLTSNVLLAQFTTFHIGGPARFFIEVHTEEEIQNAIAYARGNDLRLYPLGAGSNLLVPDAGVEGIVLKISLDDIAFENNNDEMLLIAGAGTPWEKVVDAASEQNLFGVENLAGIPGTIGGAPVQNIGAYGAELSDVFAYADCINSSTGVCERVNKNEITFAYRTSFFKTHREIIVMRVALRLSKQGVPNLNYPDLVRAQAEGTSLNTPAEISQAIRAIRAKKFPAYRQAGLTNTVDGTAGSFFKNPVISRELAYSLMERFSGLPVFPVSAEGGSASGRKISLAWLLDHALSLKGFSKGRVRLYKEHPLIIVASNGATASEVDAFANEIAERVFDMTGVMIEREVETFGEQK